ncbi:MAG: O-antigen ligase domain-containing protein [Polyangiaceae bacterium]|nr:O-antigen ligase domain-containing protein [Polyangiaceae bacterium]
MFSTPGIAALIVLIYMKPQEFVPGLEGLPLLYVMLGVATLGLLLDLRLAQARLDLPPQSPYVITLLVWSIVTYVVKVGGTGLPGVLVEIAILFVIFFLISTGIQSFRSFEFVATSLLGVTMFVAFVCFHQGISPLGCAVQEGAVSETLRPDGRPCMTSEECYSGDAEPGAQYQCEKTGLFGTVSVGSGRVRYRGVLKDPNEVALTCSAALPILLARLERKASIFRALFLGFCVVLVGMVVIFTQSRGGVLVFLAVWATYFVRTFGIKGAAAAAILGAPLLLLGGRSGREAEDSTGERSEVLMDGLQMFFNSPIFGVGYNQYTEHTFLTAHNSYMLALSENGFLGLFLFLSILVLSIKTCVTCLVRYKNDPDARVARTWAIALLASLGGACVGSFFLSFTSHHVLWIYLAMTGALYVVIRRHDPTFKVSLNIKEHLTIGAAVVAFVFVMRVALRNVGH